MERQLFSLFVHFVRQHHAYCLLLCRVLSKSIFRSRIASRCRNLYDDRITYLKDPETSMFQKIPVQALSDTVARQLLEKIDLGAFPRGGKLPTEAVLAQEFGVSRTVVREALSRLKHEGLVEPRQGSGVFVTEQAGIKPL